MLRVAFVAVALSLVIPQSCAVADQIKKLKVAELDSETKAQRKWLRKERDRANNELRKYRLKKNGRLKTENAKSEARTKWMKAERERSNAELRKAYLEKEHAIENSSNNIE